MKMMSSSCVRINSKNQPVESLFIFKKSFLVIADPDIGNSNSYANVEGPTYKNMTDQIILHNTCQ